MSNYYTRDGSPISFKEWAQSFESFPERFIAKTKIDGSMVSTIWLGLDQQIGDGPPLIFETLVFDGPLDGEMDRYSTEEQAIAGHVAMCARVRSEEKA